MGINFGAMNVYFAALMAATKFHLDGPETLSLGTEGSGFCQDPTGPWTQICRTPFPRDRAQQSGRFDPAEREIGQYLTITHPTSRASSPVSEDCELAEQSHACGAGDTAASG